VAGAGNAGASDYHLKQGYDIARTQCMYSRSNTAQAPRGPRRLRSLHAWPYLYCPKGGWRCLRLLQSWVDFGDERTRVQVVAMRSVASGAAFHRAYLFMPDRYRSDVRLKPPGEYSTS
jgi:hypothetical protein